MPWPPHMLLLFENRHDMCRAIGANDAVASLTRGARCESRRASFILGDSKGSLKRVKASGAQTRSSHRGRSHSLTPSRTDHPRAICSAAPTRSTATFPDAEAPFPVVVSLNLRRRFQALVPSPTAPAPRGLCVPASVSLCGKHTVAKSSLTDKRKALQHENFLGISC